MLELPGHDPIGDDDLSFTVTPGTERRGFEDGIIDPEKQYTTTEQIVDVVRAATGVTIPVEHQRDRSRVGERPGRHDAVDCHPAPRLSSAAMVAGRGSRPAGHRIRGNGDLFPAHL